MTLALVTDQSPEAEEEALDRVFFALSDPVRRAILRRLDDGPALVSELAEPFAMSLQAVSRHIQVLVRAGLIAQERTGRIARCNLDAAPLYDAADLAQPLHQILAAAVRRSHRLREGAAVRA